VNQNPPLCGMPVTQGKRGHGRFALTAFANFGNNSSLITFRNKIVPMRFFLPLLILLAGVQPAFAQYDYDDDQLKKPKKEKSPSPARNPDRKFDPNKMSIGGYFGASFGSYVFVDVSPIVAYRFHPRFELGTGVIYQYVNYKDYYLPPYQDLNKTNTFGGRIFPRVFVWDQLFVQMEYSIVNGEVAYVDPGTQIIIGESRETFHNVFAGGGYNVPIGENSYFTILISVNLTENLLYSTRQPYVSFGFGVGL